MSLWNVTINYGGIKAFALFFTYICPSSHSLSSFFKTVASLFSSIDKISETHHRRGQTFEPSPPTQLYGTSDGPRGRKVTSLGYCRGYGTNKYSAWPVATPPSPGGPVCVFKILTELPTVMFQPLFSSDTSQNGERIVRPEL